MVQFSGIKRALVRAYQDVVRHHTLQVAAALSYYFVLSVFPGLIFLSAVLGLLPRTHMFNQVLAFMSRLLPPRHYADRRFCPARCDRRPSRDLALVWNAGHYLVGVFCFRCHH